MTIRDKILKSDLHSEVVYVPAWDVKIEVRQKTVKQQYDLIDKVRLPNGDINSLMLAVETVISTSYDPDTGERVFDDADRDSLLQADNAAFGTILAAANRASGMESEDEVVSRLDETPAAASSTG